MKSLLEGFSVLSRPNTSTDEGEKAAAFLASLDALTNGKVHFSRTSGPERMWTSWGSGKDFKRISNAITRKIRRCACASCPKTFFLAGRSDKLHCSNACLRAAARQDPRRLKKINAWMKAYQRRARIADAIDNSTRTELEAKGYRSSGALERCRKCGARLELWIRPRGAIREILIAEVGGRMKAHFPHESEGRRKTKCCKSIEDTAQLASTRKTGNICAAHVRSGYRARSAANKSASR